MTLNQRKTDVGRGEAIIQTFCPGKFGMGGIDFAAGQQVVAIFYMLGRCIQSRSEENGLRSAGRQKD